ncbi:MAG: hypothetical protein HKO93_03325, partial [Flavobacteriales bacterium]|nr:hypothetical protein [Flavobacteriales bacterium]
AQARSALSDFRSALHLLGDTKSGWSPVIEMISSLNGMGIQDSLRLINGHKAHLIENSWLEEVRRTQNLDWFEQALREEVLHHFLNNYDTEQKVSKYREMVSRGESSPLVAARRVLKS